MYNYKKHLAWAELKVGIVVTVAIFILFLTVMFAANIEEVFSPKVKIHAIFDDVKGLREGAPVWFSGIEIGSVKALTFAPEQRIKIKISIKSDALQYMKKDSKATVLTQGLLGDKYVEISPGTRDAEPLEPDDDMEGATQIEFQDIVRTSQESIERLTDFMTMLEEVLVKIEKGEGTVSKFLKDPSIYDNITEMTEGLSKIIQKVDSGGGSLARLLNDDRLYQDMVSAVADVRLFAETLGESEGTIHKLIKDPLLYDKFLAASESLDAFSRKLLTSEGTISRLLEDESLYENVYAVSEKLNVIMERIDRGEGVMGTLITDEELTQELKITLTELSTFIKEMKENPRKYFRFSLF
jgi:phospholipid/cholesterol/gamma-HCH transport system substrate-binding protein